MSASDSIQMPEKAPCVLILIAGVCFALGVAFSPEFLFALGIMRDSITSNLEHVQATTFHEIRVIKGLLFVTGALLVAVIVWWRRLIQLTLLQSICDHSNRFYVPQQANKILNGSLAVVVLAMVLTFIHLVFGSRYWNPAVFVLLNTEDGLVENASALLFLACSLTSVLSISLVRNSASRKTVLILFTVGFFLCFGEEISWGQRVFGFGTPEFVKGANVQDEMNLHNMFGYFTDHLFFVAVLVYTVVFPVLQKLHPFWRSLFSVLGLPLPSLGLSIGFLMISLLQKKVIWHFLPASRPIYIKEIRELLTALGLLLLLFEYRRILAKVRDTG